MANFETPFSSTGPRRSPTGDEKANGFPCGPADQTLFNGLFHRIEAELGHLIQFAGLTPTDADLNQVRKAVVSLIDAATGGGETESYLLMSQATARLPIYPEIVSTDGRINLTAPATGTVRVPGGVSLLHRGINLVTTVETDFATVANQTYHLRWSPDGDFELFNVADVGYNPGTLAEADETFDSTFDDALIARIVTSAGNVATITSLANKHDLNVSEVVQGTSVVASEENGANWLVAYNQNWGRRPTNKVLTPASYANAAAWPDHDFTINLGVSPPVFLPTRYGFSQRVGLDFGATLWMQYDARA